MSVYEGSWRLVEIAGGPGPFHSFALRLEPGGVLGWEAHFAPDPTDPEALFGATGSGTWEVEAGRLRYTSGDHGGEATLVLEGDSLVLDRIPAVRFGEGTRCVFVRA